MAERKIIQAKIKKCPFCGGVDTFTVVYYPADGEVRFRDRYAVLCDYRKGGCGAESGHWHSPEEAILMWNTRRRKYRDDGAGDHRMDSGKWG